MAYEAHSKKTSVFKIQAPIRMLYFTIREKTFGKHFGQ